MSDHKKLSQYVLEQLKYGPRLTLFGSGAMVRGVEEAILACPQGKSENFLIEPGKAFGERRPALVRMVAAREFSRQGVSPEPGMFLTLDGTGAKVKSVASGRVVVDFNHPLAGEPLLYSIKVLEVISDGQKKIEAILSSLSLSAGISKKGENYSVSFPKASPEEKVGRAKRAIAAAVPGAEFKVS